MVNLSPTPFNNSCLGSSLNEPSETRPALARLGYTANVHKLKELYYLHRRSTQRDPQPLSPRRDVYVTAGLQICIREECMRSHQFAYENDLFIYLTSQNLYFHPQRSWTTLRLYPYNPCWKYLSSLVSLKGGAAARVPRNQSTSQAVRRHSPSLCPPEKPASAGGHCDEHRWLKQLWPIA